MLGMLKCKLPFADIVFQQHVQMSIMSCTVRLVIGKYYLYNIIISEYAQETGR